MTKKVIAIVDDDDSVRQAISSLLRSFGYAAVAFDSGAALLKSDARRTLSCLIADLQMRGMSGIELHQRLIASGERVPTILITAYPDETGRERALRAGVRCYLTKPFSAGELLACIASVLEHTSRERDEPLDQTGSVN